MSCVVSSSSKPLPSSHLPIHVTDNASRTPWAVTIDCLHDYNVELVAGKWTVHTRATTRWGIRDALYKMVEACEEMPERFASRLQFEPEL